MKGVFEHLQVAETKLNQLKLISAVGIFVCILFSWKIWIPSTTIFPTVPVFNLFNLEGLQVLYIPSILFFVAFIVVITTKNKLVSGFSILIILVFLLGDYNRLQPWVFYFLALILIINLRIIKGEFELLVAISFILACVYFYSGIQKFNYTFAFESFPWLVEPVTEDLSAFLTEVIQSSFWIAALIETIAGIGLITHRFRKLSAILLLGMHLFILFVIGPTGHNTNHTVWPWNIGFSALLIMIFIRSDLNYVPFFFSNISSLNKISLVLLFSLLPVLTFFNIWPKNLSASLYSSNKVRSEIIIPDEMLPLLPSEVIPDRRSIDFLLDATNWTNLELGVSYYPSVHAHMRLFQSLCTDYPEYADWFVFILMKEPNILTGDRDKSTFFCADFQNLE